MLEIEIVGWVLQERTGGEGRDSGQSGRSSADEDEKTGRHL